MRLYLGPGVGRMLMPVPQVLSLRGEEAQVQGRCWGCWEGHGSGEHAWGDSGVLQDAAGGQGATGAMGSHGGCEVPWGAAGVPGVPGNRVGASECGFVEGLELDLGPLPGYLPTSLPQAITAQGRMRPHAKVTGTNVWGKGRQSREVSRAWLGSRACPQR